MQTNNKTNYAAQLRQVRDSLTNENWFKGCYYSIKNNQNCFCVHGAAQTVADPSFGDPMDHLYLGAPTACEAAVRLAKGKDLFTIWQDRSHFVRKDRIFDKVNHGSLNLHWLMGMFGITPQFNDNKNTTLEMLKDKLTEAAKWAEENEEFLNNN